MAMIFLISQMIRWLFIWLIYSLTGCNCPEKAGPEMMRKDKKLFLGVYDYNTTQAGTIENRSPCE